MPHLEGQPNPSSPLKAVNRSDVQIVVPKTSLVTKEGTGRAGEIPGQGNGASAGSDVGPGASAVIRRLEIRVARGAAIGSMGPVHSTEG
jgi:hypothetical protein